MKRHLVPISIFRGEERPLHRTGLHKRFLRCCAVVFCIFLAASLSQAAQRPAQKAEKAEAPINLTTAIIQVARENIPAVAHIEVTERQEVANPFLPFESDPFFQRFFGFPKMPKKFKREVQGLGSGMILDDQGHILTNHHVAGGATKIDVLLSDGRKFSAKLVGTDPKTDLAVIRIPAKGPLPHVKFGDSDKLEVGTWVVAIGHPRGLDQTVTQGIISAKHRRGIVDPSSYTDFLQTDAAINPGNSGGPLLNLQGEVIGVNAAIASESGGFEGIGFTIPSNMAKRIADTLIARGKVERGWLGVSIQDMTPELAKSARSQTAKGAYIADVVKGGPADKGGIKKGDVIVAYDGKNIPDSVALRNAVADTAAGRDVKLAIIRDGKKEEKTVRIASLDKSVQIMAGIIMDRLGADVRTVTSKETEKYGLEEKQGVVITKLDAKGPLAKAGFEVGDLILGVNNQQVQGLESFITLVGYLKPGQKVSLMALDHNTGNTGTVMVVVR